MPIAADAVLEFLRHQASHPVPLAELAAGLGLSEDQHEELATVLAALEPRGDVYQVHGRRYATPERINLVVGRLSATRRGDGYVIPREGSEHVHIAADAMGSAHDGDRVVARLEKRRRGGRAEGEIIRVLERGRQTIVGTYHERRGVRGTFGYVVPEDRKLRWDVVLPAGHAGEAEEGQVVVVRITDWGGPARGPAGEVERVLGRLGEPGVDVEAIIHGHELPTEFPSAVEAEAVAIGERGVLPTDLAGREDLRERLVFTIDPADAKDHDDALSIDRVGDGLWEVGVHIADVSHYVREGTALDQEALQRGTSTYLVDRVIPMLPHALSSDLCSLRPGVDRLTLSLMVVLDEQANVQRQRLVRSVIRSRHKLAYEQAQAILDGGEAIDAPTADALQRLLSLSRALRAQRQARGSLDFDLPEARVVLDTAGAPIDIQRVVRLETHRLIEDFMLLANETIAQQAFTAKVPFIYRVHEKPETTRLEQLKELVSSLGLRLGKGTPRDLQRLLTQAQGRPDEALVSMVVLRTMQLARYSAQNLGHFGLAARHYTHFTSPIRRYPDLIVHRLCARIFLDGERARTSTEVLEEIAVQSSERERVSTAAERDSIELKKAEFMQQHIGDVLEGTIANVRGFGFFVLVDAYYVEGLVHVSSLGDDYYHFLEDEFALEGEHTGRRFRVGDRVKIRVASVDLEERKIDFLLAEPPARRTGRGRPPRRRWP